MTTKRLVIGILVILAGTLEYVLIVHIHSSSNDNFLSSRELMLLGYNASSSAGSRWQRVDMMKKDSYFYKQRLDEIGKKAMKSAAAQESRSKTAALLAKLDDVFNKYEVLMEKNKEGALSAWFYANTDTNQLRNFVENDKSLSSRKLSPFEAAGNNIMITIRTVQRFHNQRLPLLYDTWLSKVNGNNVFLVTDDKDPYWQEKLQHRGIHYVMSMCKDYERQGQICCLLGTEMAEMFSQGNEFYDWLCHVDDDIYVLVPPLVELLSKFDPKRDAVYLGRAGNWGSPLKITKQTMLGKRGDLFYFAVGGMICLSRAMLELGRSHLIGGSIFASWCRETQEPDDVTLGIIVGVVLNETLKPTEKIYTHGLHLQSTVDPNTLDQQVAFSYGYGSFHWGEDQYNAIDVPGALFSLEEDESQFRSLHCHLYPEEPNCLGRQPANPILFYEANNTTNV